MRTNLSKEIEELKAITQNYNAIGGETFGDDRIIVCSMKYFDDGYFKKNYIFVEDEVSQMLVEKLNLEVNDTVCCIPVLSYQTK